MTPRKRGTEPELRVLACDRYDAQWKNLRAIVKTLDAMRGIERWGAYSADQAAEGAKLALPPPEGAVQQPWRAILGDLPAWLTGEDAVAVVQSRWRKAMAECNGEGPKAVALNLAIESARAELRSGA